MVRFSLSIRELTVYCSYYAMLAVCIGSFLVYVIYYIDSESRQC